MDDIGEPNWKEIIPQLLAFTMTLVKANSWFGGEKTDSFFSGKEANDYVYGAITKYLNEPEKFNPVKGTFLNYLKFNLIRDEVYSDLRRKENKTTRKISSFTSNNEESEENSNYEDLLLPVLEHGFEGIMDYKAFMACVEDVIASESDSIVEQIYLGVVGYNLKRREVIEEFDMTEKEYSNGIRRLETIFKNIGKKLKITKESLYE